MNFDVGFLKTRLAADCYRSQPQRCGRGPLFPTARRHAGGSAGAKTLKCSLPAATAPAALRRHCCKQEGLFSVRFLGTRFNTFSTGITCDITGHKTLSTLPFLFCLLPFERLCSSKHQKDNEFCLFCFLGFLIPESLDCKVSQIPLTGLGNFHLGRRACSDVCKLTSWPVYF